MNCRCHDEPMYRCGMKGFQCAVRKKAKAKAYKARQDEAWRERARAQQLERWHRPDGGYIRHRRRALAAQRADIQALIRQLAQEAETLVV